MNLFLKEFDLLIIMMLKKQPLIWLLINLKLTVGFSAIDKRLND
jgi:hypothetical protein